MQEIQMLKSTEIIYVENNLTFVVQIMCFVVNISLYKSQKINFFCFYET